MWREERKHKERNTNSAGKQAFLALPFVETVTWKTDHSVCPSRPVPRKEPVPPARDRTLNCSLLGQPECSTAGNVETEALYRTRSGIQKEAKLASPSCLIAICPFSIAQCAEVVISKLSWIRVSQSLTAPQKDVKVAWPSQIKRSWPFELTEHLLI